MWKRGRVLFSTCTDRGREHMLPINPMSSPRLTNRALVLLLALFALPNSSSAQSILFVRAGGGGDGDAPLFALGIELQVPVARRVSALGGIGGVAAPVVCNDGPRAFGCDSSWLANAGVMAAVINAPRFRAAISATGGAFRVGQRNAPTLS